MNYISVKHNTQDTTNIHINVFIDIVRLLSSKINGLKIINTPEVIVVRKNKNIDISFSFTIEKNMDIFQTTNTIKKLLSDSILNLIDLKPHNILMNYQGRH